MLMQLIDPESHIFFIKLSKSLSRKCSILNLTWSPLSPFSPRFPRLPRGPWNSKNYIDQLHSSVFVPQLISSDWLECLFRATKLQSDLLTIYCAQSSISSEHTPNLLTFDQMVFKGNTYNMRIFTWIQCNSNKTVNHYSNLSEIHLI